MCAPGPRVVGAVQVTIDPVGALELLWAREGAAARLRIERDFSLANMAAAYQEVYEAALAL